MAGGPVLVGREGPLRQLGAAAVAGRHILVVGDAGVGKTSLVSRWVAGWIAGRRGLALQGRCAPVSDVMPLLPVIDAIGSSSAGVRAAVDRAMVGLRPARQAVLSALLSQSGSAGDRGAPYEGELFLAVGDLLTEIAETRPVVLAVEDVHWGDPKTLNLLSYLMIAREVQNLVVVATFRSDEAHLGSAAKNWLSNAEMSSRVDELRLTPLTREAFEAQLEHLGVPMTTPVADRIFARSEGNPFFTEQLVAAVAASAGDGALPERLSSLLTGRLQSVSMQGRLLMHLLAYAGRPLSVDQLASISRLGDNCGPVVTELSAAALVTVHFETVAPRHALLREVALAQSTGLPKDTHRRLARVLEGISARDLAPEAARHYRVAGSWRDELRAATVAAERAWEITAYDEAATWGQRVMNMLGDHVQARQSGSGQGELAARTILALHTVGRLAEKLELADLLWDMFQNWPDAAERGLVLAQAARVRVLLPQQRSQTRARQVLADTTIPEDESRAWLLLDLGIAAARRGDMRESDQLLRQCEETAERCSAWARVVDALLWRVAVERGDSSAEERDALTRRAEQIAQRDGTVRCLLNFASNVSDIWLKAGRLEDVIGIATRGLHLAAEQGLESTFIFQLLRLNSAEAALELGRVADAVAIVDSMYEHPARPADLSIRAATAQARARIDLARKHDPTPPDGAWEGFDFLRQQAELEVEHQLWARQPDHASRAAFSGLKALMVPEASWEHSLCGGLMTLGMRACADLAEEARRGHDPTLLDSSLVRLRAMEGLRQRFIDEFGEDPLRPREAIGRTSGDAAGWDAERRRVTLEDTADDWARVVQTWSAMGYAHRAGYAQWRGAMCALRDPSDRQAAVKALQRAHELSEEHVPLHEEVVSLARRIRLAGLGRRARVRGTGPGSLTLQEQHVLRLIASGMTDSGIAEQLVISVRTANAHVSNILRKLEVPNRGAASRWAHANGLAD